MNNQYLIYICIFAMAVNLIGYWASNNVASKQSSIILVSIYTACLLILLK